MSAADGPTLAATTEERTLPPSRPVLRIAIPDAGARTRIAPAIALGAALLTLTAGFATLFSNDADPLVLPALVLLATALVASVALGRAADRRPDVALALLAGAAVVGVTVLLLLPGWLFGADVNGIVHRSVVSGPLAIVLGVAASSWALRGLLGSTPSGRDLAFYPVLLVPVGLALVAYTLIIGRVVVSGTAGLDLDLLTTAYAERSVEVNGVPTFVYDAGLRNHILGTLLLIAMTLAIALLPGVGTGVFLAEYPGPIARVVDFSTTMLRAVSMFIIGAAAVGIVGLAAGFPAGTIVSDLIRGVYTIEDLPIAGTGSFLLAAMVLALLVTPVIAKLTEDGLRSVPRDIREGSVALGTTEGYTLRRILLPWASINVVTALLLGAAEASGSLAVIMFIATTGQQGVGPLSEVTSLDYALFASYYGPKPFVETMLDYRFTTALLLLVLTLGLTIASLLLRSQIARRYRGTLSGG